MQQQIRILRRQNCNVGAHLTRISHASYQFCLTQHLNKSKWDWNSIYVHLVLTIHEHFKLLVVKLCFFLRDEGTFSTLAHGVHKTHARQRHFFTAAFVTEALSTSSAVMLSMRGDFVYLQKKLLENNLIKGPTLNIPLPKKQHSFSGVKRTCWRDRTVVKW